MSLADIDAAVSRIRIQDIADTAKKSFEANAEQSAQLDAEARAAADKEKADLEAALRRRAEAEAEGAAAKEEKDKQEPKAPPKRATMSLGAEEFKLDRQARQATDRPRPTPRPTPRPVPREPASREPAPRKPTPKEEPPRPGNTLKLGARSDDEAPSQQDKPARKRPPRPEADDDLSGKTWLR